MARWLAIFMLFVMLAGCLSSNDDSEGKCGDRQDCVIESSVTVTSTTISGIEVTDKVEGVSIALDESNNLLYVASENSNIISVYSLDGMKHILEIQLSETPETVKLMSDFQSDTLVLYSKEKNMFQVLNSSAKAVKCVQKIEGEVMELDSSNNIVAGFTRENGLTLYDYDCKLAGRIPAEASFISRISDEGEMALVSVSNGKYFVSILNLTSGKTGGMKQLPDFSGEIKHRVRLNNRWIVFLAESNTGSQIIALDRYSGNFYLINVQEKFSAGGDPQLSESVYFLPSEKILAINLQNKEVSKADVGKYSGFSVNLNGSVIYFVDQQGVVNTYKSSKSSLTMVYVTILSHNERNIERFGAIRESKAEYEKYRNSLIKVAELMRNYSVKYDWQTDYLFLEGMQKYENQILTENPEKTNGKNVLKYLSEDLMVSIEPHAHECIENNPAQCKDKEYNYADVAFLIENISGVKPASVVGGTTEGERSIQEFEGCIKGKVFDYTWCPEILTVYAGSTGGHKGTDDMTSGVWKPNETGSQFYVNNPNSRIIYVGSGSPFSADFNFQSSVVMEPVDYLNQLVEKIDSGQAPAGKIYTASLVFAEDWMINMDEYNELENYLKQLKPLIDSGKVIPATYPQVVEIWKTQYNSQPNIYLIENFQNTPGSTTLKTPSTTLSQNTNQGKCGDGICDNVEKRVGKCPQDCG